MPAIWLMPMAMPRSCGGKASVSRAGAVGEEEGAADPLHHAKDQQLDAGLRAGARREDQQERAQREDGKAQVVQADPPEHVRDAAEGHQQGGGDHHVAHHDPEQEAGIARRHGVEGDAAKDRRQRDHHDAAVDACHQHPDRRVGEHNPLVAVAPAARQRPWASPSARARLRSSIAVPAHGAAVRGSTGVSTRATQATLLVPWARPSPRHAPGICSTPPCTTCSRAPACEPVRRSRTAAACSWTTRSATELGSQRRGEACACVAMTTRCSVPASSRMAVAGQPTTTRRSTTGRPCHASRSAISAR